MCSEMRIWPKKSRKPRADMMTFLPRLGDCSHPFCMCVRMMFMTCIFVYESMWVSPFTFLCVCTYNSPDGCPQNAQWGRYVCYWTFMKLFKMNSYVYSVTGISPDTIASVFSSISVPGLIAVCSVSNLSCIRNSSEITANSFAFPSLSLPYFRFSSVFLSSF